MVGQQVRIATVLFAASVIAAPAFAGKKDNSVRFGDPQVLDNADPYFNSVRIGVIFSHHVWDTLIYRDPKTNAYRPSLATSWKWVDDTTLDVELRKGVKFHNGAGFLRRRCRLYTQLRRQSRQQGRHSGQRQLD